MNIKDLFKTLVESQASDLHLAVGLPPMMRVNGKLAPMNGQVLSDNDITTMLKEIIPAERAKINPQTEVDLGIEAPNLARFRANIYHDRKGICAALRLIPSKIKSLSDLGLPEVVEKIYAMNKGLVLVTGVTGSGKSTTLASIVDKINSQRSEHIITIEDPIEFVHEHKKSMVNQREIGAQTASFADALRAALREDPNVILVGEMRDLDTISMAVTAAETGHLVLATLHSSNAPDTVNRIIDVFPPHQQDQIRIQLAESLAMVVSQALLPSIDGSTRFVACEVMTANTAIKNLIREKQTHQIRSAISVSNRDGMQTMDQSIKALFEEGKISREVALQWMLEKNAL
ncbi:MAG: type IV pilus twitching motility protein PilT [Candidatus Omnitrophota bacterium]